jgi:hypothetical protein
MTQDGEERLVIGHDDLPPEQPTSPPPLVQPAPPAGDPNTGAPAALPSVEGVRPAPTQVMAAGGGLNLGGTWTSNVVAALVAAGAGWAAFRLFFSGPPLTTDLVGLAAKEFAVFGAVFGAVVAAWDDATSRVWESALPAALTGLVIGAIGGAISGAVAQDIYGSLVENILEGANFENFQETYESADFFLTRALGWAIFGLGVGFSLGVAKRSTRKTVNATIGGVIGGALGGLVFHYVGIHVEDEAMAQLIGFAVVGLGIGAAVGLVEVVRRQAWLKVVGGGMTGKEFILYHAHTNVGSAPRCEITLIKDSRVSPFHCRIDERSGRYSIVPFDGSEVRVNGAATNGHWLQAGDRIELGDTALSYSERRLSA